MSVDPWLPIGFRLPDGTTLQRTVSGGEGWQISRADGGSTVLVVDAKLVVRWELANLVAEGVFSSLAFGPRKLRYLVSGPHHKLTSIANAHSPNDKAEAVAFATAMRLTRQIDQESPLQDALFVEKLSRLLPTYSISSRTEDDVVLGFWLSGGVPISAKSFRRLHQGVSWLGLEHLRDVVEAAGFEVTEVLSDALRQSHTVRPDASLASDRDSAAPLSRPFELPGRPELESFINEHIVDVLRHRERYHALGIGFPSAVVLHGPPGSGKTYAVDRLVEYLGWPSYQVDASSIASPFIHETSRKVAEVFERAQQSAPSVLVIDEMEAFLADREIGTGHHRVEEIAEFLRRIPEAAKNDVLIIGMTNRIDMIDPAVLRRGRFDHVISVGYASQAEVHSLLDKLLAGIPTAGTIDIRSLADGLADRPLSDVAFVVREGARLAARAGKSMLDQASLSAALQAAPPRASEGASPRRVGFV